VVRGEAYYFNDWPTLIEMMLAMSSITKDWREGSGDGSDPQDEE